MCADVCACAKLCEQHKRLSTTVTTAIYAQHRLKKCAALKLHFTFMLLHTENSQTPVHMHQPQAVGFDNKI